MQYTIRWIVRLRWDSDYTGATPLIKQQTVFYIRPLPRIDSVPVENKTVNRIYCFCPLVFIFVLHHVLFLKMSISLLTILRETNEFSIDFDSVWWRKLETVYVDDNSEMVTNLKIILPPISQNFNHTSPHITTHQKILVANITVAIIFPNLATRNSDSIIVLARDSLALWILMRMTLNKWWCSCKIAIQSIRFASRYF